MQVAFRELLKLLQIALTIPVTTASCERSFSTLKRIKSYLRSRIGQDRLSSLAELAIEREMTNNLDLDRVVNILLIEHGLFLLSIHVYASDTF